MLRHSVSLGDAFQSVSCLRIIDRALHFRHLSKGAVLKIHISFVLHGVPIPMDFSVPFNLVPENGIVSMLC